MKHRLGSRIWGRPTPEDVRWRLHVTRLGSFLSHARAIRALVDDGHEKAEGGYIFDGHYPVTLVDRAFEHLDALLYDAAVLGVERERFEGNLLKVGEAGRALGRPSPEVVDDGEGEPKEPEDAHLARVLDWLEGAAEGEPSVLGLVFGAIDALFGRLGRVEAPPPAEGLSTLPLPGGDAVEVFDLGGGVSEVGAGGLAPETLRCTPLSLMVCGALEAEGAPARRAAEPARWLAVVDRFHLSLRRAGGGPPLFLEATLSGRDRSDGLFTYEAEPSPDAVETFGALRTERTGAGLVHWHGGASAELEGALRDAGARLFGHRR